LEDSISPEKYYLNKVTPVADVAWGNNNTSYHSLENMNK